MALSLIRYINLDIFHPSPDKSTTPTPSSYFAKWAFSRCWQMFLQTDLVEIKRLLCKIFL